MKELLPHVTSPVTAFQPASLDALEKPHGDGKFSLGSFSKDGTFAWITRGSNLEVVNTSTSERIAAWSFGSIIKDFRTTIICVKEYECEGVPRLLIGLETSNGGMLCLFDVKTSKIVRAIEMPDKVTCVEPVTTIGMELVEEVFSEQLQLFCGVVAVGFMSGKVHLIDLCLDDDMPSDEIRPSQLCVISARIPDLSLKRDVALRKREHLCLLLDSEGHIGSSYHYKKPDGTVLATFAAANVCVTCLKFIPQMGVLAVGFNFGYFQLWKLTCPVLEYTVAYERDDLAPITHFIYQEPENDPRSFVYVWAVRGPTLVDTKDGDCSALSLYQFGYNRKVHVEHHGILYKDMTSALNRFEHMLAIDPYNISQAFLTGSTTISCGVIEDPHGPQAARHGDEDSFEGPSGSDLSLCMFVWEAVPEDTTTMSRSMFYIGLFDMNKWYHSQMPGSVKRTNGSHDVCPFFAFYNMEDILEAAAPDGLFAAHINADTVTRYHSSLMSPPEQHFYPSSLGFDVKCLTDSGIVRSTFLGVQQQALASLGAVGPKALAEPLEAFDMCLHAGLVSKIHEVGGNVSSLPASYHREALLTVCLEHAMMGFISTCITQWSKGEYNQPGCNLRYMLNWAWKKVTQVKDTLDKLCVPLYDCSGTPLDEQTINIIHKQKTQLKQLVLVFQLLLSQSAPTTEQGSRDLQTKLNIVSLLYEHVQVVTWFLINGLLPEHAEGEDTLPSQFSYPASSLAQVFAARRKELNKLHSDMNFDLLMIDGMVDHMGQAVKELWDKEGGNGLYPPPSLHALLNIYLLEDVPVMSKHSIFIYIIFDLLIYAGENMEDRILDRWIKFAQAFNIPQGMLKLIQGLWLLDHKDFEGGVHMLLDPMVTSHILPWQHTRVIKALLYQSESKLALRYMKTRQPPMVTPEDVKLKLTVLLANGLISEAFEYQRTVRDQSNTEDLLAHLYNGCQQTKTVDKLLQLSMDSVEERQLVQYLQETSEPNSLELLVMYYLQNARYVEAVRLNEKLKRAVMLECDPHAKERTVARNTIVDGYLRTLPQVQRKLIFGPDHQLKKTSVKKTVVRPEPLSTVVNRSNKTKLASQASLLAAVLEKVHEVKQVTDENEEVVKKDESFRKDTLEFPKDPGPFICTPMTPRVKSRIAETNDVIYPTVTVAEDSVRPISPTKKMFGLSPSFGLSPVKPTEALKRRVSKYVNAEALSLLKTPPVRRKSSVVSVSRPQPTPQSILKVRQVMRRSPSPKKETPFKTKPSSGTAVHMDTPPRLVQRVMFEEKTTTTTVKQLRFSIPRDGSPEFMPEKSDTPQRNVRERSPTPERFSPKVSPQVAVSWERLAQDEEMEENVQRVDEEITFNLNRSKVIGDHQEEEEEMDTEPMNVDVQESTAKQSAERVSPPHIEMRKEAGDSGDDFTCDISIPHALGGEQSTTKSAAESLERKPLRLSEEKLETPKTEERMTEKRDRLIRKPLRSSEEKVATPKAELKSEPKSSTRKSTKKKIEVTAEKLVRKPLRLSKGETEKLETSKFELTVETSEDDFTKSEEEGSPERVEIPSTKSGRKSRTPSRFSERDVEKFAEPLVIDTSRTMSSGDAPSPIRRSPRLASKESDGSSPVSVDPTEVKEASPELAKKSPEPKSPKSRSRKKEIVTPLKSGIKQPQERGDESEDADHASQSSPLSSGSFMMKLRSGPKGSREATPEFVRMSDHDDAGADPVSFTFAMPLPVESTDSNKASPEVKTPKPQPFIFSPPITRSRGRRRQSEDQLYTSLVEPHLGDISMQSIHSLSMTAIDEVSTPTKTTASAKKPTRSARKKKLPSVAESVSDSPINFVSPAPTRSTRSRRSINPPQGDSEEVSGTNLRKTRMTTRSRPKTYKLK